MKPHPSTVPISLDAGAGGKATSPEPRPAKSTSAARACPPMPSVCLAVLTALASAEASPQEVGSIVAQDPAISARLLQAVNSAHYGLARRITDPADAVTLLGFQRVWALLAGLAQADDDTILAAIDAAHAGLLSSQPAPPLQPALHRP
jgi:HD-like signal output (HDOD) protein